MASRQTIELSVLNVLRSAELQGDKLVLTCGQLDRQMYQKVNKVLEGLGGKWSRKDRSHVFDSDCQERVEAVIEAGEYATSKDFNPKQFFGFFETPDGLADEIVRHANIGDGMTILEPSAGSGQLVRAVRRGVGLPSRVIAVEVQGRFMVNLNQITEAAYNIDFLKFSLGYDGTPLFDRVVMNPPFAKQADIDHVMHAWSFLKDGGRLVAIMSAGWTFRTNSKSEQFQQFVASQGRWWPNDDDAFKQSGTMVKTVSVVLYK
jgi:phospholipid N-methyltransferase